MTNDEREAPLDERETTLDTREAALNQKIETLAKVNAKSEARRGAGGPNYVLETEYRE